MTPQPKAIFCQHDVWNEMPGRLEDLPAFIPAKSPEKGKKGAATYSGMTDVHLDPVLEDLVRLRVAQIHGCKWSVQEQKTKLKTQGETYQRLRLVENWRTGTVFSDRERAALNLAEAISRDPISTVSNAVFHAACVIFSEIEVICLILATLAANDWHYLHE